jgi:hypothetical protein
VRAAARARAGLALAWLQLPGGKPGAMLTARRKGGAGGGPFP